MELKDYYQILELPPSATTEEVKKAYRRMAHAWHPDKRQNDPYAAARFALVKEAYETLTNPARKDQYLQQRWYARSAGTFTSSAATTPVIILNRMIEIERYVSRLDEHRMDKPGLTTHLLQFFSGETVELLNSFNDQRINGEIIRLVVMAASKLNFAQRRQLYAHLLNIRHEPQVEARLRELTQQTQRDERWAGIKIWLTILIVAAICILIFLAGKY